MASSPELEIAHMRRAIELAEQGRGLVEPNPLVGAVVVRGSEVVGEGFHSRFGGPHAEIEVLRAAGSRARGATLFVTLEPCCHYGKTPPCTDAIVAAGIRRVSAAMLDPYPAVAGQGVLALEAAGIEVSVGLGADAAREQNAPYLKRVATSRPWIIAKWAMSLDGKIATRSGQSRWISGEAARAITHHLRGRVDAILIGRGTADADDPLLTARPQGPRLATRIVLDSQAGLSPSSQLVRTARDVPLVIACASDAPTVHRDRLSNAGCELLAVAGQTSHERLQNLLSRLASRGMTNILVEGGRRVLGSFFDAGEVDEVHVFVAPSVLGGMVSPGPVGGAGVAALADARRLENPSIEQIDDGVYIRGRIRR